MPPSMGATNISFNKKCGEIIVTIKKNAKNVYSFNCWFCDTICIQMKKFTTHLEREHEKELEEAITEEECNKIQDNAYIDGILVPNIKIEECLADDIKSENNAPDEMEEEGELQQDLYSCCDKKKEPTLGFLDPLETMHSLRHTTRTPVSDVIRTTSLEHEKCDRKSKHCVSLHSPKDDVEMEINSEEEEENDHAKDNTDDEMSIYSDYKPEDSGDEEPKEKICKRKILNDNEEEITIALINGFKKFPQLWDTSQKTVKSNVKQKDDLLQTITKDVNNQLKSNLKLYTVKKKLSLLCKQFENEVENELNDRANGKVDNYTPKLRYYKQMEFLKAAIESKFKQKRKKPKVRVKPLSDKHLCDLIEIYKNYKSLWDVKHLAFTIKEKRHETMESMLNEIETKMDIHLDIFKLEKYLGYIHKLFAKDKHLRLECENMERDFEPSCLYYSNCEFLEPHQGPFRCAECSEIIDSYNDFQIHRSTHDGSMPFKCHECGMGFKKISNYTIHAKRHLRVFKFHCKICGKGYPFNAELDLHMRSHTGAQPFLCSICGEGFRTAISYDNHIRRHEERFKYFCHICKKGFNHMTRLNDHVKAHLNVRDVICTVCGKGFTSRKYLNHHKRIHEGKNYNCNICGKSFAQDAGLRAHKKYHGTPIGVSSIQKEQNKYNFN